MSMFTGLHPGAHGVKNYYGVDSRALSPDVPLLAELLLDAGYHTVAYTGGGMMSAELGFERGFDLYDDQGGGGDRVFARAIDWLDRAIPELDADEPFFLFVHTYEIHDPYTPPAEWQERFTSPYDGGIDSTRIEIPENGAEVWKRDPTFYEAIQDRFWGKFRGQDPRDVQHMRDLYDAGIAYTDHLFETFWQKAREHGLDDDVILIVTSDHGEEFQEHGGMSHQTIYEEILGVPLIVRPPGGLAAGARVVDTPVSGVDLMPSILELAGLAVPEGLQGRSWLPALSGASDGSAPFRWAELATPKNPTLAVRRGPFKLLGDRFTRDTVLFDLESDPAERNDVKAANPEEHQALAGIAEAQVAENATRAGSHPTIPVKLSEDAQAEMDRLGYTGGEDD